MSNLYSKFTPRDMVFLFILRKCDALMCSVHRRGSVVVSTSAFHARDFGISMDTLMSFPSR